MLVLALPPLLSFMPLLSPLAPAPLLLRRAFLLKDLHIVMEEGMLVSPLNLTDAVQVAPSSRPSAADCPLATCQRTCA